MREATAFRGVVDKVVEPSGLMVEVAQLWPRRGQYPDTFEQLLVHTGRHYDPVLRPALGTLSQGQSGRMCDNLSKVFFEGLELPQPDIYLGVGSGSHAEQTARVTLAFEPVLLEHKPDWVIVVGDVNSTVACALTAAKLPFDKLV
jgi:UDP-N-acetylglucosamine 2-epimerase (non-hydrolysing)